MCWVGGGKEDRLRRVTGLVVGKREKGVKNLSNSARSYDQKTLVEGRPKILWVFLGGAGI